MADLDLIDLDPAGAVEELTEAAARFPVAVRAVHLACAGLLGHLTRVRLWRVGLAPPERYIVDDLEALVLHHDQVVECLPGVRAAFVVAAVPRGSVHLEVAALAEKVVAALRQGLTLYEGLCLGGKAIEAELDQAELPTVRDLQTEAAEAALAARVDSPGTADPAGDDRRPRLANDNDARDAWLRRECLKGTTYGCIIRRLRRKPKAWERLESAQGIRGAVRRYCERHGLPCPAPRQRGRKPQR